MNKSSEEDSANLSISSGDTVPSFVLTNSLPNLLLQAANGSTGITTINRDQLSVFTTYKDLLNSATCILSSLRQKKLKPQDKVILYLQNTKHFFASLWGCWLGGFVPVPLGIELNSQNKKLNQAQALCNPALIISDIDLIGFETTNVADLFNAQPDYNYHFSEINELALLLFTSGSTGNSKAVMLSTRNLLVSIYGMAQINGLSQQDITLNWMPIEHVASLVMFHLTEVYLGCEQIQVKSELILPNPLRWLDLINQFRVTATWSPNFAYSLINENLIDAKPYDWDLSCLRWMGNGAEAVVGRTAQKFLELLAPYGLKENVVSPGYGMSETTSGIVHSHDFALHKNREFTSVGQPIPGVSLRIVDDANLLLPEGETGLLHVKGETVSVGYYQQLELDQEIFTADGWFNTGDLGFLSAGQLTITGRQKEVIIINGVNYYNHEIETIVEEIANVNLSYTAACSVRDDKQQEQIAVFFSTDLKKEELRDLINQIRKTVFQHFGVVPAYIIPAEPETIPKTAIGKIMRSQLSQRFAAGEFNSSIAKVTELFDQRNLSQQDLPGNAIEQRLVKVWQQVLHLANVGIKDNFFELGGNSLLLMEVLSKLTPKYDLGAVTLFQYPTIAALASYLNSDKKSEAVEQGKRRGELRRKAQGNKDVAIIGMSCRFPGANNIEQFWHNLRDGVESISWFSDREILAAGVDPDLLENPNYVKASPILDNIEEFDGEFWGYSPKEAQLLDPQQRLFLECAWESLEDAGYDPLTYSGEISLFGGAATNTYLLNNIYPNRHDLDQQDDLQVINLSSMGGFQVSTANDKDYLTTRTSYKLNLKGSSVNIQTACSTSLVTVHLACQSLINAECDIALSGGVSVHSPQKMGYLYQEGMILSEDGHCRAFDADATGTIFGSGAGMVVLKLLDRAIADGDHIYGVIKGSAINNDGGDKVGYLAPNVDGQTRVISEALAYANISPKLVGYIEAHGTGTKLGDPIEITALSEAYCREDSQSVFNSNCAIGAVKTNVGHLQMASGIVGLIKATLCLYHQQIPPTLHFNHPNPQLNLERSSFYINTKLEDWIANSPRRAGVNSLGIGGTNAHVILEEFVTEKQEVELLPAYLLTLSAKTESALHELIASYQEYLSKYQDLHLKDICLTSNIGRHHFNYRLGIVARHKQDLISQLSNIKIVHRDQQNHQIAWLFTGQGSQYVGMANQLYDTCAVFREHCDRCFAILQLYIDIPLGALREALLQEVDINQTQYAQPILFTIEYSLAQMWLSWGIIPDVVMGHSIGEYVAAAIVGVFSLEDALKLLANRGKLMQALPANGAMLAVFAPLADIDFGLDQQTNIAADNGSHIVISGLREKIELIARRLESQGIKIQLLNVSHGFHSELMEPIVAEFKAIAETINYDLPQFPIVSNLTGQLANATIATADYWVKHILQPVKFAQSLDYLANQQIDIFLEIGTKPVLSAIAQNILEAKTLEKKIFLPSLIPQQNDWESILISLSKLYGAGLDINWSEVTNNYHGQKISLPTYPFQRQRYWFDIPQTRVKDKSIDRNYNKSPIVHPLLGKFLSSPLEQTIFQAYLQADSHPWLKDHCLDNQTVFPGAAYLEMAISVGLFHCKSNQLLIEDIDISTPLYIEQEAKQTSEIQTIISRKQQTWHWSVHSSEDDQWQLHCSGKVSCLDNPILGQFLTDIKAQFDGAEIDVEQHYLGCEQKGINYGQSFQGIKQLWTGNEQALGLTELELNLDTEAYHFHPALLDACLQILFAALPPELQFNTYIPVGLDRFLINSFPNARVWSYLKLKPTGNDKIISADVWLYNDDGNLIAKLEGLKSQVIKSQPTWHNWLYQSDWQLQPLLSQANNFSTDSCLILTDTKNQNACIGQELAKLLSSQEKPYHLISRQEIANNPQAFAGLVQKYSEVNEVIYLWSLDSGEPEWSSCQSFLYLVQALTKHSNNPKLWFITRNVQPVKNDQIPEASLSSSCLWGMQKAIALEHPELHCTGIDIDYADNAADLIFQEISIKANEQVAYRNNNRYVNRLERSKSIVGKNGHLTAAEKEANIQLQLDNPGNLDSLRWETIKRSQLKADEIELAVKATGLNFRDVMVALDLYPDETKFLGLECTGIVTKVGSQVDNFAIGDEVMAIASHSFSQYLNINSLLAIHKPESLDCNEAATIPVTFLTAYYTLVHLAQLQPGEKVLIHAAAGGVGLAAIQIAQNIGAEVYATASAPKWKLLQSMGVTKIMNSRSLNFADEIMSATNNLGVDVVLNSLSGEFIAKSISVLNENGRFIEIGKQGIWSPEDVSEIRLDIQYSVIDLWQVTQSQPEVIQQMLSELRSQFINNQLKPLPYKTFTSDRAIDAFREMQQGKHQGKIIISMDSKGYSRITITPKVQKYTGTYLITGGMGAIGLQVAEWLITKGINSLVLMGRSDVKPELQALLEKLRQYVQVTIINADVSDREQLTQALNEIESTLPPLRGVIHCAGVTSDRTILQQDWSSFTEVLAPKAEGAWNLHCLTQAYELENFIMFSSAVSLIGSAGQANYCAANAFLDTLAHARRSQGLPAISINWGAWKNTGLAANSQVTKSLNQKGMGSIQPDQGIKILDQLLISSPLQIGVIPINWDTWSKNHQNTSFYDSVLGDQKKIIIDSDCKQQLLNIAESQRQDLLVQQISQQVSSILGIKDINQLDLELGFTELGLDSLASVELRNKIQSLYELKLAQTAIFDYPNIRKLGRHLIELIFSDKLVQNNQVNQENVEIKNLSEAEAESALLAELENIDY